MTKITIFTGAGISAESGIPTFRDFTDRTKKRPEEMTKEEYQILSAPKIDDTYKPNRWHYAVTELAKKHEVRLFTQNIDSLHEKSGYDNFVFHVHGTVGNSVPFGQAVQWADAFEQACIWADSIIVLGTSLMVNPWFEILAYDMEPKYGKWLFTKDLDAPHIQRLEHFGFSLRLGEDCFYKFTNEISG